jgi:hypothetical protein
MTNWQDKDISIQVVEKDGDGADVESAEVDDCMMIVINLCTLDLRQGMKQ